MSIFMLDSGVLDWHFESTKSSLESTRFHVNIHLLIYFFDYIVTVV